MRVLNYAVTRDFTEAIAVSFVENSSPDSIAMHSRDK